MTPRLATTGVFLVNGAVVGTWVAQIPALQARLEVSRATLGLCLLSMAAGAALAMPLTGHLLERRSSAAVTRVAALVFPLLVPLPLLAGGPLALAALLLAFGAANGVMDVAMNAHGVAVERALGRPVISSMHAGWSIGGFAASGAVALATAAGLDPRLEALLAGLALASAALVLGRSLGAAAAPRERGGGVTWPSRRVLLLGALALFAFMTEGAIDDWSGVYLRQSLDAGAAVASTAFAGFSLGMAAGRLGGDALRARLGTLTLLRAGMTLVALALAALLAVGAPLPAIVGFALAGLGVANGVPLLFSVAGRLDPPGPSLAAVSTFGYAGFIAGPPLIGLLSDATSLPATLALVAVCALAVALLAGRAVPRVVPA